MVEHTPVLCAEVVEAIVTDKSGYYIDATFGDGGHARTILDRLDDNGTLLVIDQDATAIEKAFSLATQDKRVVFKHGSFKELATIVYNTPIRNKGINGILMDLGLCSAQIDNAERGFSFMRSGPLDMRMNTHTHLTAQQWISRTNIRDMAQVFKTYGEERFAKRIATAIGVFRKTNKITNTAQLATIVAKANPAWEKNKHPATRVFQAIRIHINQELDALKSALPQAMSLLEAGGRLAVISFHSLEDNIVKRFINKCAQGNVPINVPLLDKDIVRICKKNGLIHPTKEEVQNNPRSRSAIMRVAEKI